eukprot:jgi/Antlo1/1508/2053
MEILISSFFATVQRSVQERIYEQSSAAYLQLVGARRC